MEKNYFLAVCTRVFLFSLVVLLYGYMFTDCASKKHFLLSLWIIGKLCTGLLGVIQSLFYHLYFLFQFQIILYFYANLCVRMHGCRVISSAQLVANRRVG